MEDTVYIYVYNMHKDETTTKLSLTECANFYFQFAGLFVQLWNYEPRSFNMINARYDLSGFILIYIVKIYNKKLDKESY